MIEQADTMILVQHANLNLLNTSLNSISEQKIQLLTKRLFVCWRFSIESIRIRDDQLKMVCIAIDERNLFERSIEYIHSSMVCNVEQRKRNRTKILTYKKKRRRALIKCSSIQVWISASAFVAYAYINYTSPSVDICRYICRERGSIGCLVWRKRKCTHNNLKKADDQLNAIGQRFIGVSLFQIHARNVDAMLSFCSFVSVSGNLISNFTTTSPRLVGCLG